MWIARASHNMKSKPSSVVSGFSGFTLVELLLVLVVLAVLAGGVVVALAGRRQTYELQTAAKDLATALEYAHANARLNNRPYRVLLAAEGNDIQIETVDPKNNGGFTPARGIPGRTYRFARGVSVVAIHKGGISQTEGPFVIQYPPGDEGGVGQIDLVNSQGQRVKLEVALVTGFVTVSEVLDADQETDGGALTAQGTAALR